MRSPAFWFVLLVVSVWQLELAVHSGIAASRRRAAPKAQASTSMGTTVCTGTSCPPSPPQLTPQRVLTSPR